MIAGVIVDVSSHQVNKPFDYLIPEEYNYITRGYRVIVPFGNRKIIGFVVDIKEKSEFSSLRSIISCLDVIPCLNEEMFLICCQMAYATHSFLISCFKTALPNALGGNYKKKYQIINYELLSDEIRKMIPSKKNGDFLGNVDIDIKIIKKNVENKALEVIYECGEKGVIKSKKMVKLTKIEFDKLTSKQTALVDLLMKNKEMEKSEVIENGFSSAIINALVDKGICQVYEEEKYRDIKALAPYEYKKVELNLDQEYCFKEIINSFGQEKKFLLHGVTGSGKTEVYLEVIEETLKRGYNAIMLVPEISLTPQMVNRFKGRFSSDVAVFHSALSINERYDEWRRVNRQEVRIVVGARSAVFAPLTNIGVIIIDEAHEMSYQQDNNPKYNAKDIAALRSRFHSCPLVLGTATPSVIDYNLALNGEYQLLKLPKRANNASMPLAKIVDMSEELRRGNKSPFSEELQAAIKDRLQKNEQIILLINRRGYSTFVLCRSCGEALKCPSCDITLTYHEAGDYLKCHYCNFQMENVSLCPSCGSKHIKFLGTGTQRVVDHLSSLFPQARVLRMDADTTVKKGSHEEILYHFGNHDADILVGTQMISKGLDFPKVTLVGILLADSMLKMPDFKASEKTFDLISQVSGRAGRHNLKGEVIIQTYSSSHYSITCACEGNYLKFYNEEMRIRNVGNYPPYCRMATLVFSYYDKSKCMKEATKIADSLPDYVDVLGPSVAPISKLKDRYRVQLTLRYKRSIDDILNELNERYVDQNGILLSIEKM